MLIDVLIGSFCKKRCRLDGNSYEVIVILSCEITENDEVVVEC